MVKAVNSKPSFGRKKIELSNEKKPGCLGYIGDEKLPNDIGIIMNHYKDPYEPTQYFMESVKEPCVVWAVAPHVRNSPRGDDKFGLYEECEGWNPVKGMPLQGK